MKLLIALIAGMLISVGGVVAFFKIPNAFTPKVEPATVRVETIVRGDLIETVSAPGEVQPRVKVSISAKVSAPIIDLPFKEGDRVIKGKSVLARLDAKDLQSALKSAQARFDAQNAQIAVSEKHIEASRSTIESMQANLVDAERDLKRQMDLHKTNDVSQSIVDTAQTKVDSMRAQLRSSEFSIKADEANLTVERFQRDAAYADVAKATDDLSYTVIVSPIDGVVTRRRAEVGEMVVPGIQGSPGTTILEVADLSQMLMVARVDEASVTQVLPGQHATVRMQAFGDNAFDGIVEWVANSRFDPTASSASAGASATPDGSRFFECKIRLYTKGEHIRSGLSADADIEVNRHHGLRVQSQAVLGRPTDSLPTEVRAKPEVEAGKSITTVVYRMVSGKAVATPVTVGPSDETHTLIKSGLKDGDAVIVGPYKLLESLTDGQAVKPEAATTKASTRP
jgi:HlyD family secretion protein